MPRLFTRFRSSPGIPFQNASSAASSYQHYDHNGQLTIHEETEDDDGEAGDAAMLDDELEYASAGFSL